MKKEFGDVIIRKVDGLYDKWGCFGNYYRPLEVIGIDSELCNEDYAFTLKHEKEHVNICRNRNMFVGFFLHFWHDLKDKIRFCRMVSK